MYIATKHYTDGPVKQTLVVEMTMQEAGYLTASIRHITSGNPSHNEATPVLEFLMDMLKAQENA